MTSNDITDRDGWATGSANQDAGVLPGLMPTHFSRSPKASAQQQASQQQAQWGTYTAPPPASGTSASYLRTPQGADGRRGKSPGEGTQGPSRAVASFLPRPSSRR